MAPDPRETKKGDRRQLWYCPTCDKLTLSCPHVPNENE